MKKKLVGVICSVIVVAVAGFFIFRMIFPMDFFVMDGKSMEPVIKNGETMALEKYDEEYKRHDIIIINNLKLTNKEFVIKRIIGLPGEKIKIKDGHVFIGDILLKEDYVKGKTVGTRDIILGNNQYFVMGDNRMVSSDSRSYGPIVESDITGKVILKSK